MSEVALTQDEVLRRWPRLTAHMICESLGYFSPRAAANAIIRYKQNEPFFCEWYSSIAEARGAGMFNDDAVRQVGKDVLRSAIQKRHHHRGFMADYNQARAVIASELAGNGPIFASWF